MTAPAREGSDLQLGTAGVPGVAWSQRYEQALMNTFGPPQRVLVRGEGCYVWDADGNRYLDLLAGIAVNALGHAHPMLVSAVTAQLATLGHVSNFFASAPQITLAERLLDLLDAHLLLEVRRALRRPEQPLGLEALVAEPLRLVRHQVPHSSAPLRQM